MKYILAALMLFGSANAQTKFRISISEKYDVFVDIKYNDFNVDSIQSIELSGHDSLTIIKAIIRAWLKQDSTMEKAKAFNKKYEREDRMRFDSAGRLINTEMNISPNVDYYKNVHQYCDTIKSIRFRKP